MPAKVKLSFTRVRRARKASAGTLIVNGHSGKNKLRFAGRISATKKLKFGRYTVTAVASGSGGQTSKPRTLGFKIVKPIRH